jgi:hypothetical protein
MYALSSPNLSSLPTSNSPRINTCKVIENKTFISIRIKHFQKIAEGWVTLSLLPALHQVNSPSPGAILLLGHGNLRHHTRSYPAG